MNPALAKAAAQTDPVMLENALHAAMMRERGDFLSQIEAAQVGLASGILDMIPTLGTVGILALVLFLTAYLTRPAPTIVLPGVGAFGIPARRKRKSR